MVYAEITTLTPSTAAACNSVAVAIPGVTKDNGGLWSYGDIAAGASAVQTWAFSWSSGVRSTFSGRIVAFGTDRLVQAAPTVTTGAQPCNAVGTATKAIFRDEASKRKLTLVGASGSYTQSAVLDDAINWIATSAVDGHIWVSLDNSQIARLDASGTLIGYRPLASKSSGVTVDPNGVVWFTLPGVQAVGWYDPSRTTNNTGQISLGGEAYGPVAVNRSGACYLYALTKTDTVLKVVDCSGKTKLTDITLSQNLCANKLQDLGVMVAGAGGDVWFSGFSQSANRAQICKINGATVTRLADGVNASGFFGLAYGSEGNVWVMDDFGISRAWLGAPAADYGKLTQVVVSNARSSIVAGAGAVWAPVTNGPNTSGDRAYDIPAGAAPPAQSTPSDSA
jgi:streptogramin lyase